MDTNTEPVNPHTEEPVTISRSITQPRKLIISNALLQAFIDSVIHAEVVDLIENLNQSTIGLLLPLSENIEKLLEILETIEIIALAHPPDDKRSRIDYGSGMEFNFLCWLLYLNTLRVVGSEDYLAVVLKVFWKYIEVMRYLQSTYWLKPVGSHRIPGLDDYHFLPFLFEASQLTNHKYFKPKSIHGPDVLEGFSHQYMYLACIEFINSVTTASLPWHSPMLDDMSGVKTWDKVNSGMIKMYKAEVLAKMQLAQHFLSGTPLPFPDADDLQKVKSCRNGRLTKDSKKKHVIESSRCLIRPFTVKLLSIPWMAVLILMVICLNTVQSNTLIESFGVPRNPKKELQIDRFLLIKHSDSNEESKNSREDERQSDWEGRIRGIVKKSGGDGLEDGNQGRKSTTEQEPSTESTEIVSIKPNRSSRLRLKLSKTTDPQKFSYLFLMVPMDEQVRRSTGQAKENLFDPFSNSIDHSANALRRFFGAPPIEEQRFSVRFSWDASDHVDLHLDLDHSPSDLITISSSNPAFFNLTITPNFDKFSDSHSTQTDSFVDLIVIIEPLLLNLLPMFTLLPLFSTCVCILVVVYAADLPTKFENFIKNFAA